MKKTMIVLSAVFALMACNKVAPETEINGTIDASKFVIDIAVNHPDDTKAVKSGWENGDKVYVFFDNVTGAKYVELTYNSISTSWTSELKGELAVSNLNSNGIMYGVYFPFEQPVIAADNNNNVIFKTESGLSIYTYYMTGSAAYTVNNSADITTLTGSIDMINPEGYVQFYIGKEGENENEKYNADGKYRLSVAGVKPTACAKFDTQTHEFVQKELNAAQPMWGYVLGEGVAFSGKIDDSWSISDISHKIYLFDTEAAAKTITISGKTLESHKAVNFSTTKPSTWSAAVSHVPGRDVIGTVEWGKFNIGAATDAEYGWYFAWGDIIPATGTTDTDVPGSNFGGFSYYQNTAAYEALNGKNVDLTGEYAIYDMATAFLGSPWRMPTKAEYTSLCNSYGWDNDALKANNVKFPAAGNWNTSYVSEGGLYWSSSHGTNNTEAYDLNFFYSIPKVNAEAIGSWWNGLSVRPVQTHPE